MVSTLLVISCMPTISLASACNMPMDDSAMAMQSMPLSASNDDAPCSIACGCGCNQHLDGLPHLLSPHLVSQEAGLPKAEALDIAEVYPYSAYSYIPSVQLPPPNLS